jgi:ABC-2 type transport system ATP-binding protein
MTPVLETTGLGRRYRRHWALRDCSLRLPGGRVVALVGPNGAGKTTLLQLVTGLLEPSAGSVRVLGHHAGSPPALARVAFVAQDKPLYADFTVAEMLRYGRSLNPSWDQAVAKERLRQLDIPFERRCGRLSGGQQAQVALALALAKRPELLILDEPLANLDPLARREFMEALMAAVAEHGLTAVLSSHVIAELESVCDHLVLLSGGRVQVAGDIEALLDGHRLLVGARREPDPGPGPHTVVRSSFTGKQASYLVRTAGPVHDPRWEVRPVGLEELVLAYMREPEAAALPRPALAAGGNGTGSGTGNGGGSANGARRIGKIEEVGR